MLLTSESVTCGHPDKVADQISDTILDAYLEQDPNSRVAVETMYKSGTVVLGGEVSSLANVDIEDCVNSAIDRVGYNYPSRIVNLLSRQSSEIRNAVDSTELGAGDQGIMYGYACIGNMQALPHPFVIAREITDRLTEYRETGVDWLYPDGKSQVTMCGNTAEKIVVSAQHMLGKPVDEVRSFVEKIVQQVCLDSGINVNNDDIVINPAGPWTLGGADADCGVTGRKIMVDSYGTLAHHGGGAFSGKDPSKVDRSAAYAARHAAKWLVDTGRAIDAEVSLAYAIGVADPIMVGVKVNGYEEEWARQLIKRTFDFRPQAIIERLDLLKPIYKDTARFGHFGRDQYPWEDTDL